MPLLCLPCRSLLMLLGLSFCVFHVSVDVVVVVVVACACVAYVLILFGLRLFVVVYGVVVVVFFTKNCWL